MAVLCLATAAIVASGAAPLHGQTSGGLPSGDGVTAYGYPITCPTFLTAGFSGFFYGIQYGGYEWSTEWQLDAYDPATRTKAYYVPQAMYGANYITSRDNKARWYNPRIKVACGETDYELGGVWIASDLNYQPIAFFGTVRESVACSGTGGNTMFSDASYDPYDSIGTSDSSCESGSGYGGSGDGAGGCHEEIVAIEISTDGGGSWTSWWEGLATVCDQ